MSNRYWIVGVTPNGFYRPTLERVTKKQIAEGQRVFTVYEHCGMECSQMNEIAKTGNNQELYNFVTRSINGK